MKLALSEIVPDQRAQPRTKMDGEVLSEYGKDMKRGDKFPPIVVFSDGKKYWLADGFHRYYSAPEAERDKLDCDVRSGDLDDAIWFSCGANKTHGFRRTNEDKRRAVLRLVTHPKFKRKTQEEIAEQCGVTQQFVSKIIKELEVENTTIVSTEAGYIEPADEAVAAPVGEVDPKLDGPSIGKSLHEIERHLDMMPSWQDALANFPTDQRFRFPPSKLDEMAAWLTAFAAGYRSSFPRATE